MIIHVIYFFLSWVLQRTFYHGLGCVDAGATLAIEKSLLAVHRLVKSIEKIFLEFPSEKMENIQRQLNQQKTAA